MRLVNFPLYKNRKLVNLFHFLMIGICCFSPFFNNMSMIISKLSFVFGFFSNISTGKNVPSRSMQEINQTKSKNKYVHIWSENHEIQILVVVAWENSEDNQQYCRIPWESGQALFYTPFQKKVFMQFHAIKLLFWPILVIRML